MADKRFFYEKEKYLSLWLCVANSKEDFYNYFEIDYSDDDEEEYDDDEVEFDNDDEIDFQLGRDFQINWYDEDFFEASYEENVKGWDLLKGHSFVENIIPILKDNYNKIMGEQYNSIILIYNLKYDGHITEVRNEQYGFFKFIGSFRYLEEDQFF